MMRMLSLRVASFFKKTIRTIDREPLVTLRPLISKDLENL